MPATAGEALLLLRRDHRDQREDYRNVGVRTGVWVSVTESKGYVVKTLSLLRPALLAAVLISSAPAGAAISVGANLIDTPANLEIDFIWDHEFRFEPQLFAYSSSNWKVQGAVNALALPGLLYGSGSWSAQHLDRTGTDLAPGELVFGTFSTYFNGITGGTTGFDTTLSVPGQAGAQDVFVWHFDKPNSTGHISAIHLAAGGIPPVPEPETYAMLLAGLGVVGWRLRSRQH